MRIVDAVRRRGSGPTAPTRGAAVDHGTLQAIRVAVDSVEVPEEVRRFIVEAAAATRVDPALLLGVSTVATLDLVRATAARAASESRDVASVDDARRLLRSVFDHRIVAKNPVASS